MASSVFLHLTRIKVASCHYCLALVAFFGEQMEIALWLVYADWGMLLLLLLPFMLLWVCLWLWLLQPVAALIFIYIFLFFLQPLVCLSEGLKIYAQARAADSYFFAFNKASSLQKFSPAFLGIFCWKFNLLQNVRRFLHIFQQNSWFTIFVSFSCSAVPHKSRILSGSFAVFRHWKSMMNTWHETHCIVSGFSF